LIEVGLGIALSARELLLPGCLAAGTKNDLSRDAVPAASLFKLDFV
jgi:hypothetical protein